MKPKTRNIKNILITPLGWGLGHAGRMVPVAMMLKEMGHNVSIAGNEESLSLFRNETTGINLITFDGFRMRYSTYLPASLAVMIRVPSILFHSLKDHFVLRNLIKDLKINIVISDNRFGCWNKSIKSVYITHQLRIFFPFPFRFLEPLGIAFHRHIIKKYDWCLIPDFPGEPNLSGNLSHNLKLPSNARYIGLLSRFSREVSTLKRFWNNSQSVSVILSGPEPQKSILKHKLINVLTGSEYYIKILEAGPELKNEPMENERVAAYINSSSIQMRDIIAGSEKIICRSGYSTIMDLITLGKAAILIPTPGQTEQEYLAEYLSEKGWFSFIRQNEINLSILSPEKQNTFPPELLKMSDDLLSDALMELSE